MEHLAVKAAVSEVTDLGEFEALAATYSVDRVRDKIIPGAFENTIAAWQDSGRMIPVHWAHSGEAKDIIGGIDPGEMREVPEGLFVKGKLDLQRSEVAREAWRSMKANTVALSFGYMTVKSRKRDGINELIELDLFEISVAPGPINPETRFLSLKAATAERRIPTESELRREWEELKPTLPTPRPTNSELRRHSDDVALQAALGFKPAPRPEPEPEYTGPTQAELRRKCDMVALDVLTGDLPSRPDPPAKRVPTDAELRRKAAELGYPIPPSRRRPTADPDAIRAQARDHMFALLTLGDEQANGGGEGSGP